MREAPHERERLRGPPERGTSLWTAGTGHGAEAKRAARPDGETPETEGGCEREPGIEGQTGL